MFSFRKIWKYLWPEIKKYKVSCVLMFAGYGVGVVLDTVVKPYFYKEIVDAFTSGHTPDVILHQVTFLAFKICIIIATFRE